MGRFVPGCTGDATTTPLINRWAQNRRKGDASASDALRIYIPRGAIQEKRGSERWKPQINLPDMPTLFRERGGMREGEKRLPGLPYGRRYLQRCVLAVGSAQSVDGLSIRSIQEAGQARDASYTSSVTAETRTPKGQKFQWNAILTLDFLAGNPAPFRNPIGWMRTMFSGSNTTQSCGLVVFTLSYEWCFVRNLKLFTRRCPTENCVSAIFNCLDGGHRRRRCVNSSI